MAQDVAAQLELEATERPKIPAWRRGLTLARQHPLGVVGLLIVMTLLFAGIFGDLLPVGDAEKLQLTNKQESPSLAHPFGTDNLGRDVLGRTIMGARISLLVGLVSVSVGITIGTFLGVLSGYAGKFIDSVIQRGVDIMLAFPAIVLLLAIITVTGDDTAFKDFLVNYTQIPEDRFIGIPVFLDIFIISVGIGIAVAVGTVRVVRGAVLSLKENVYIDAARAMGASDARIMWKHIFPNVAALVVVLASVFLPIAILAEAAISFLGIGVPEGTPSWGADLTGNNREDTRNGIWWPVFFPGLALTLVVLGFNLLGDAFRDIADPRRRGSRGGGGGGGPPGL